MLSCILHADEIEEIIVTGTLIEYKNESDISSKIIYQDQISSLNISTIAELSKYLTNSSGSRFQTNSLDGVDQGMSNINLKGLDNTSTLLLINGGRHTIAGTPSSRGSGYVDTNIIPEIFIKRIEIINESSAPQYGSDAVAGVINIITEDNFNGIKVKTDYSSSTNYNFDKLKLGLMYGKKQRNSNFIIGIDTQTNNNLAAAEIPDIAELAVSNFGKSFKVTQSDIVESGLWSGVYEDGQKIPDPDCLLNNGILTNENTCGFNYGERFNIINDEDSIKSFIFLNKSSDKINQSLHYLISKVDVNDNPQSPSYPALPFLSRLIYPNEGGSPFNVPVRWYGRPLGSEFPSPYSPKDINQFNLSYKIDVKKNDITKFKILFSKSKHSNNHKRPDIIDSRFLDAIKGFGGPNSDQTWNLFDSSKNSNSLIEYVSGAESSYRVSHLEYAEFLINTKVKNIKYAIGFSMSNEKLNIEYDELSRAEFNNNGQLTKIANLFFLGGGKNVNKSRKNSALFFELNSFINKSLEFNFAGRYNKFKQIDSFNPKTSFNYSINSQLKVRGTYSESFVMPSMAQMFSSDINLGSVRDINDSSIFVRQALIGNENLEPAYSRNYNFAVMYNNNLTKLKIDYWNIKFKDRIELESTQTILNSDPYGDRVTRNDEDDLMAVTGTYFNEASTLLSGYDVSFNYSKNFKNLLFSYTLNASRIDKFLTPNNSNTQLINRSGYFNYDNHTFSMPKNRINTFLEIKYPNNSININTRYIDSYLNKRPLNENAIQLGYSNKIKSFFVLDASVSRIIEINSIQFKTKIYCLNVFDKSAPKLYDAPDFSFDTRVHDPTGRIVGINFEYEF